MSRKRRRKERKKDDALEEFDFVSEGGVDTLCHSPFNGCNVCVGKEADQTLSDVLKGRSLVLGRKDDHDRKRLDTIRDILQDRFFDHRSDQDQSSHF